MYESEDFKQIKAEKYPNNGHVFLGDYELLDFDIKNDMFLMDGDFFISEDHNYLDKLIVTLAKKELIIIPESVVILS
jgi:membrane-associated PAP2 superfamily phosphatase